MPLLPEKVRVCPWTYGCSRVPEAIGGPIAGLIGHPEPFDGVAGKETLVVCKSSGRFSTPEPPLRTLPHSLSMFALLCVLVCLETETHSYCPFIVKRHPLTKAMPRRVSQDWRPSFQRLASVGGIVIQNHHIRSHCSSGWRHRHSRCVGLVLKLLRQPPASASQIPGFRSLFEDVLLVNVRL